MKRQSCRKFSILLLLFSLAFVGCGINSVTEAELDALEAGDVLTWRYQKLGKSWFYATKVASVDDETVSLRQGKYEVNKARESKLFEFDESREPTGIKKSDLRKYATEQGLKKKVVIIINKGG